MAATDCRIGLASGSVRRVRFAESADELSGWRAKPNFRALGPRLGPRVQEAAKALAADDGSLAARLATGESVTLDLAGGAVELSPGDVELAQETQEGWGLASDGPVTVRVGSCRVGFVERTV